MRACLALSVPAKREYSTTYRTLEGLLGIEGMEAMAASGGGVTGAAKGSGPILGTLPETTGFDLRLEEPGKDGAAPGVEDGAVEGASGTVAGMPT